MNFLKTSSNKAQDELMDTKNQLYDLQFNLDTKMTEVSEAKREITGYKKKLKHLKYYKEKAKNSKGKLKNASRELQDLEIQYKNLSAQYQQDMQYYTQNVGVVLDRDRLRCSKFQVKSITHSINKLLGIELLDPLVRKE